MGRLIDDMLHLARISHGELNPGPTDLGALAREIVAELREQQPDRNLDVRIAEGLVADADPDFIRIALANLLSNAVKFTGNQAAPRIDFASETRDGEVVYYVRDNGAGFDMMYADRVFRPFERLHSQDEFPGTGIGLATVQRVIRRHGGRIWADAAIGRGATFFFTLAAHGARPTRDTRCSRPAATPASSVLRLAPIWPVRRPRGGRRCLSRGGWRPRRRGSAR